MTPFALAGMVTMVGLGVTAIMHSSKSKTSTAPGAQSNTPGQPHNPNLPPAGPGVPPSGPIRPTDGGGGPSGTPDFPDPATPGGSPFPAVGTTYRPDPNVSPVIARAFQGRGLVQSWAQTEKANDSSPAKRFDNLMAAYAKGQVDSPTWKRIPVRDGLEVEVMIDVVKVGGVRICGPEKAAQAFADFWGALIMTPGIVDATWTAGTTKCAPQPFGWYKRPGDPKSWHNPGGSPIWTLYEADRNEAELDRVGRTFGQHFFVDLGKSYVLTADCDAKAHLDRCCIYGWHNTNGSAIQSAGSGQSFIHELTYFDYSHAIRLVKRRAWLNNQEVDLAEVYKSKPQLVSYKGLPSRAIPSRHPAFPNVFNQPGIA